MTRLISPRPRVRVAVVDAYGDVLNDYSQQLRVGAAEPELPWAVYLADENQRFRLLAFDLDAKDSPAAVQRDAEVLGGLLTDAGIPHIVCASGPSGGRHLWAALAESVDAGTIATLARLVRHLCPTLDLAPLTNAATGCVRPPGAPHRAGGVSTVLQGDLGTLTRPTTTAANIRGLVERVARLVDDTEPARSPDPRTPLSVDAHGRLYLTGHRRDLPAGSAAALAELAAAGDASAVLWRVLIGAVAARWRYADVATLADTAPGLEHVRTRVRGPGRQPRPLRGRGGQAAILARQWDKAVRYVASSNRHIGHDPTFDRRAGTMAAHIRDIQLRADTAAGRWTHGGGPADRRILDVLCTLALKALTADLEADTRRLALLAGVGRETARTALLRLASDGWIACVQAADGPHGAHWTIDPQRTFHKHSDDARSQADPRPAGAGSAERTALLHTLTGRAAASTHDVFTASPGLGHLAGNLYARLAEGSATTAQLSRALGMDGVTCRRTLERLVETGVVERAPTGWRRAGGDPRPAAAARLHVDGRLQQRAECYRLEREVWAWWKAEEAWMRAPRRTHHSRRAGPNQLSLLPEDGTNIYGAYPRDRDGRGDHRTALLLRRDTAARAESTGVDEGWQGEAVLVQLLGATRVA